MKLYNFRVEDDLDRRMHLLTFKMRTTKTKLLNDALRHIIKKYWWVNIDTDFESEYKQRLEEAKLRREKANNQQQEQTTEVIEQ